MDSWLDAFVSDRALKEQLVIAYKTKTTYSKFFSNGQICGKLLKTNLAAPT